MPPGNVWKKSHMAHSSIGYQAVEVFGEPAVDRSEQLACTRNTVRLGRLR